MLLEFLNEQCIACNIMQNIINKKTISHAYLIETNNYYRGLDFAIAFAKSILCPKNNLKFNNCGECTQCARIDSKNFSELEIIEPDGSWIKKEQLDKLQKNFSTKSLESSNKVYIINHAEKLNLSAANSILKFLEEPEENIVAILLVDNMYSLLDTIISRCQIIKLNNKRNFKDNVSTIEKISNYLFNNLDELNCFVELNKDNEIILEILNFIKKIETGGLAVILEETKICNRFLKDKEEFNRFVEIMILFYKDCLDYKIGKTINIFDEYKEILSSVTENNEINQIMNKIEILTKIQERIKYNCNLNLTLDKLIISLGGV